jgi:hypothetical protein
MPYEVKKTKSGWGVQNSSSGEWHSKNTTEEKAKSQANLLRGIKHGWQPTGKKSKWGKNKKFGRGGD